MKRRTATKKHLAAIQRVKEWIKEHRHQKLRRMMETLKAKLQGTWNYYGLIGNFGRMKLLYRATVEGLYKWLNRRSQKTSFGWAGLDRLLKRFQVPLPRIVEKTATEMPCQREMSFCQRMVDTHLYRIFRRAYARAS